MLAPWKKSYEILSILKSRGINLPTKVHLSQSYGFSSSHVWMWELDFKGSWLPKNWCFWTVVLKKTLESPLDCKAIQPVHPKGNQSSIFIGRIDAKALMLWPPDMKSRLIRKDPDAHQRTNGQGNCGTPDTSVHHYVPELAQTHVHWISDAI